jgi:hypothetical protein
MARAASNLGSYIVTLQDDLLSMNQPKNGLWVSKGLIKGCLLIVNTLVLLAIYLTVINPGLLQQFLSHCHFPLNSRHGPIIRDSSCRLHCVVGSAAGDCSQPSQGQEGRPVWKTLSEWLVLDLAYTMELAAGSEPKSGSTNGIL